MTESNDTDGRPAPRSAADGEPATGAGPTARMWISGLVFLALAVVTFVAGDDNRWISIPAAVIAAVALVDFLWVGQRRRRSE